MTRLDSMSERKRVPVGRSSPWEFSPNAPGVIFPPSVEPTGRVSASVMHPLSSTQSVESTPQYDEVDRRLMDTFPASDAVGRY